MTRTSDLERLKRRIADVESDTHTEGERPPELTKEEKEMLDEHFDVDPMGSQ